MNIETIINAAPVIPVLTIERVEDARPLAEALVKGGLPALEVTLRTDAAMAAIAEIAKVKGAFAGVGTILTPEHVEQSKAAGAVFGVSPGSTASIIDAARANDLPLLPGAVTASEVMHLADLGFEFQKFFPAEAAGGTPTIKAFSAPLPQITFCPTGGISPANAESYLSLPNVRCIGGSWIAPLDLIRSGKWDEITERARLAAALRR
ncbi:MAG: bifunctional 4-hydroxy-2-oxoglutarate aldolase/2-dehydro-3-deoxy-phosphogluconate aldolase [Planktomarina sp.]